MSKVRKTRLRSAPNKIWTDEEVLSMLFYILDRQNDGKLFEKPTHEIFYESLMTKLMWSNVRWQQVKAKVHNIRKKYIDMKNWMDQTGQGVDSGSIEGILEDNSFRYKSKKCPFYELLHGIFGNRANVSIPYVCDSLRNQKHSDAHESNDCELTVGEIVADENGDGVASNINHTDLETLTDENDDGETLTVVNIESYFSDMEPNSVPPQIDEALTPRTLPPATNNISISDPINTPHYRSVRFGINNSDVDLNFMSESSTTSSSLRTSNTSTARNTTDDFETDVEFVSESTEVQSPPATSSSTRTNKAPRSVSTRRTSEDERAFCRFTSVVFDTEREHREEQEMNHENEGQSRIARFKKQLSERSSSPHRREIPSNAAAFISDANLKRAEMLQERNMIEMRRVENESMEISLHKDGFELEKQLHTEQMKLNRAEVSMKKDELDLKRKECQAKIDLREKHFELKCKKLRLKEMELEKNERVEKMKIKHDFKLQLELAKMKYRSS